MKFNEKGWKLATLGAASFVSVLGISAEAMAKSGSDKDCKGDRVCEDGKCLATLTI